MSTLIDYVYMNSVFSSTIENLNGEWWFFFFLCARPPKKLLRLWVCAPWKVIRPLFVRSSSVLLYLGFFISLLGDTTHFDVAHTVNAAQVKRAHLKMGGGGGEVRVSAGQCVCIGTPF